MKGRLGWQGPATFRPLRVSEMDCVISNMIEYGLNSYSLMLTTVIRLNRRGDYTIVLPSLQSKTCGFHRMFLVIHIGHAVCGAIYKGTGQAQ